MPPLAANRVTLRELADLAIGTPEVGAVNFTALHTLIVAILKSLNLQQVAIDFHNPSATEPGPSAESIRDAISTPQVPSSKEKRRSVTKQSSQQTLESQMKDLGSQVLDLSKQLKNMDNKVQGIATQVEHISTGTDLFQELPKTEEETALLAPHISPRISPQTSLTKPTKIYESTEMVDKSEPTVGMPPKTEPKLVKTQEDTSPAKSSSVLQDLIEEVKVLKEAHQKAQESPELNVQELLQRVNELEKVVKDREEYLDQLNRRLNLAPGTEELTLVTWEELEQAITDGWKASRGSSDSSSATLGKRKMTLSTSSDLPSGLFPKTPADGQALGSAGGPEMMLASGVERPPERIVSRDQSRARDLPSRAREPSQVTSQADRQRMRESAAPTGKRRDEQQPGPTPKVVPPVRDQHVGAPASQDQVLPSPEERRIAPFGMDQPPGLYPGPYPPAVMPLTIPQLGVLPPEMDEQGLMPLAMDESGVMPPSVPDRGQQRLEKASTTQLATVPLSMYQQAVILPRTDQPGMEQAITYDSGVVPWDTSRQGLIPVGINQHGFVILSTSQQGLIAPGVDQQGLVMPGIDQRAFPPSLPDQYGLMSPGLMQVSTDRQGFGQPSLAAPGFAQPDVDQRGLVQPGVDQRGLVQPGVDQRGLVQPGVDQRGVVQPIVDQRGLVQPGVDQRGLVQPGVDQRGLVQPSVDQRGVVQPIVDQRGLVQPGVDQRGLVQPGVDPRVLMKTGTDRRSSAPVGADQRSSVRAEAERRSSAPVGAEQRSPVQPEASWQASAHPGTARPSSVQPGAEQRDLVQPSADWDGLVQPSTDQQLVPPDTGQPSLIQPGVYPPDLTQLGTGQGLVQPGTGQPVWVQPSTDQPRWVQSGAFLPGLVQPSVEQHGLAQLGMGQQGLVQPGAYAPGLMQPGIIQDSLVQPFVQPGADWSYAQPGVDGLDMAQPGAVQRGLVQPGTFPGGWMQPDTYSPGLVQPGIGQYGLVQPSVAQRGEDQRGLMQPVVDQLDWMQPGIDRSSSVPPGAEESSLSQPGMGQQGLTQPGMDQYGIVQPGAGLLGLVQPGVGPLGLVQSGVGPRGLVQPGVGPLGLVQSGVGPRGLVQPGAGPRGLVQPGAGPRGLVQPGVGPRGLVQPGTGPLGLVQPGVHMPSLAPLGAYPPGAPHPRGLRQPVSSQPGFIAPSIEIRGFPPDLYLTPEQARQDKFPVTDRQGPDHQGPRIQYDQTQAVLGYPSRGHMVDVSSQASWDPSRKHAFVQFELATPDQDTTDSSTRVSLSYPQQVSSGSEVHSERQESLEKLAPSFPMAVETFRLMGELISLYMELKEHMKDLDEQLSGQSDLDKVQYLLSMMVKKTIPQDLQEQMKSLKTLTKEVRKDKDRLEKIQRLIEGDSSSGKEMKPSQLTLQLGILRVTVSDIEKELSELRESQERGKAAMENSVSEASLYLQDQLDKLRTIIESMLSSSSTLLSLSITPHKSTSTLVPGQIDPEATCPACSLDVGHQVSLLVQRYEQLQDMVSSLAASRPSKKAKLQSQDEELLGHVQSAILQVQGDCEKLNITTSNLIEDHRQKQKDIEVLYQGLERLEKEKADRDHLEMEIDVKADKSALASKVSRIQFDATTEQLNHMMQELVAKMSGQEQDWQKLLDKLLAEMDSKLDRLELDPLKQMLEDRWKSLRQQLKERSPLYQADEAAAMRRQLLAHFHCLSCDRPLETSVTGQVLSMTPVVPSMPGHRSIRPYTVFELEQVRQQSRNLKLGGSFFRGDLSQMERSVGRLRSMHSKMLMDIEKVQIHFGGSVKASSQMIRELMHAQCLSHPCYKRGVDTADYTYSTVPRRCGGSHTLTYPYRRNRPQHLSPLEEIQIAMKHDEVDILGLDGHIYKGRMDTRLPGILGKDGMSKHKSKQLQQLQQLQQLHQLQQMQQLQQAQQAQHARPHVHRQPSLGNGGLPPSRPQSAQMLADSNSVPSGQKKDRPISSEGRLSQPNVAHASIPTEMAGLQGSPSGLNVHMDVPPREGMEEPTRGPRSTTAH
ncbi:glutamine-rich protein 2 [Alexandromys fortis]|uniref:glutamine-rich protein 2 n=1 Tax=Alexandromys fortis TaxID=100897 RepID=UPI0021535BC0|nr:glutamine-rich protein 2 [Microtus fortis]